MEYQFDKEGRFKIILLWFYIRTRVSECFTPGATAYYSLVSVYGSFFSIVERAFAYAQKENKKWTTEPLCSVSDKPSLVVRPGPLGAGTGQIPGARQETCMGNDYGTTFLVYIGSKVPLIPSRLKHKASAWSCLSPSQAKSPVWFTVLHWPASVGVPSGEDLFPTQASSLTHKHKSSASIVCVGGLTIGNTHTVVFAMGDFMGSWKRAKSVSSKTLDFTPPVIT